MKKQRKKSTVLEGNLSIDQILTMIDFEDEEVEHAAPAKLATTCIADFL